MYVVSSFLANPSGAGVAPYPSTYASYVRRAHHAPPAHATTPLLHRRNRSAPPIVRAQIRHQGRPDGRCATSPPTPKPWTCRRRLRAALVWRVRATDDRGSACSCVSTWSRRGGWGSGRGVRTCVCVRWWSEQGGWGWRWRGMAWHMCVCLSRGQMRWAG
jgi:hypothetical protein